MEKSASLRVADRGLPEGAYQQMIDDLRARGCRCILIGRAGRPQPLARAVDSEACPANHYGHPCSDVTAPSLGA